MMVKIMLILIKMNIIIINNEYCDLGQDNDGDEVNDDGDDDEANLEAKNHLNPHPWLADQL